MDCESINNQLSAYMDGELSPRQAAKVQRHVANCPRCREDLSELQSVRALLSNATHAQPSPGFWTDTLQHIRSVTERPPARRPGAFWLPARATAALAVFTVACMVLSQVSRREAPPAPRTIDPAQLVSLHADLRTDLPLADSGSMRYIFTDMRTNEIPSVSNSEVD